MPTGYTAKLCEQEVPFREFILTCARAMGACITLRDEDLAPAPKTLPPCRYHHDQSVKSKREANRLSAMSKKERVAYGQKVKSARLRGLRKSLKECIARNARLTYMKSEVLDWTPPTNEHEGLKKFMIEQLEVSMDMTTYYQKEIELVGKRSALGHFRDDLKTAKDNITYHRKEQHEEDVRHGKRVAWLVALHDSLKSK